MIIAALSICGLVTSTLHVV